MCVCVCVKTFRYIFLLCIYNGFIRVCVYAFNFLSSPTSCRRNNYKFLLSSSSSSSSLETVLDHSLASIDIYLVGVTN